MFHRGGKNINFAFFLPKRFHPSANVINRIPSALGMITKALAEIAGRLKFSSVPVASSNWKLPT